MMGMIRHVRGGARTTYACSWPAAVAAPLVHDGEGRKLVKSETGTLLVPEYMDGDGDGDGV